MSEPPAPEQMRVSTRDDGELRRRLTGWLRGRPEVGTGAEVGVLTRPTSTGMSSDTVCFEARWPGGGGAFVARLEPGGDAYPVFPAYDLARQAAAMRLVGARTDAPVPAVRWFEPDRAPLGSPFLVMDRVEGQAPPDNLPYTFGSWLTEATGDERRRLQDGAVAVLATIHGLDRPAAELAPFELPSRGDTALARHVADQQRYYQWARDGLRFPIIERAFAWLDEHWPGEADRGETVLSWGDARIGNILWRDFRPVAVLDWEMVATGPREVDLGWFVYLHRFFQDLAEELGLAGLPDMFRPADVAAAYEQASGHPARSLRWFMVYAATRHAIVLTRAVRRSVHFGERPMPDDPEELILHREPLRRMLDGTYWESLG